MPDTCCKLESPSPSGPNNWRWGILARGRVSISFHDVGANIWLKCHSTAGKKEVWAAVYRYQTKLDHAEFCLSVLFPPWSEKNHTILAKECLYHWQLLRTRRILNTCIHSTYFTSLCSLLVLRVQVVRGNILLYRNFMYTPPPPAGPGKTQLISENISRYFHDAFHTETTNKIKVAFH